MYYLKGKVYI